MLAKAIDLRSEPLHISSIDRNAYPAVVLEAFNFDALSFMQYIDRYCSEEQPGRIMMIEASPHDWDSWERQWHTADVETPINALYITPCPGTEHKPR